MSGMIQTMRNHRKRLKSFQGIHSGQRAFVIGNGPSLNKMDLTSLAAENTFASNGIYHLFPRIAWRPSYYACVDAVVLRNQAGQITKMRESAPSLQCFFPEKIPDVYIPKKKIQVQRFLPPTPKTCYFKQIPPSPDKKPFGMFPKDPADGLVQPYTVTATLLQLAYLMGCNPIYLVGCDTHYQSYPGVQTVESGRPNATAIYEANRDNDPNHFHHAYFGQGKRFHEPNTDKMTLHYEAIREAAEILGLEIFNAGVDSRLECFPKVEYEGLFC
jgi:hypothetical protein